MKDMYWTYHLNGFYEFAEMVKNDTMNSFDPIGILGNQDNELKHIQMKKDFLKKKAKETEISQAKQKAMVLVSKVLKSKILRTSLSLSLLYIIISGLVANIYLILKLF